MFRPVQARWFETYVPREQTVRAMEVLASTGVVQLEIEPRLTEPVAEDRLRALVAAYRTLAAGHVRDLPLPGRVPAPCWATRCSWPIRPCIDCAYGARVSTT